MSIEVKTDPAFGGFTRHTQERFPIGCRVLADDGEGGGRAF